jgi:hypothetical protein
MKGTYRYLRQVTAAFRSLIREEEDDEAEVGPGPSTLYPPGAVNPSALR